MIHRHGVPDFHTCALSYDRREIKISTEEDVRVKRTFFDCQISFSRKEAMSISLCINFALFAQKSSLFSRTLALKMA